MQFNFKGLTKVAGAIAFVGAMVLSFTIAANAQGRWDRREWRDMRRYQNQQRRDFRHQQRDYQRYNRVYNNGYYYGYPQYNNGYPSGYYGNNGYYNNRGYYDPYYNRGYYNRGYYDSYRPHIDSRNGFKRTIHHLFGGH